MSIKAGLTIGRRSDGMISLRIRDDLSGIEFVALTMTAEAFGNAVTNLANQPAQLEPCGLEYVGKRRITEMRTIRSGLGRLAGKSEHQKWLRENAQEPGWLLSDYLGSQKSIEYRDDGFVYLNYELTKYVEP